MCCKEIEKLFKAYSNIEPHLSELEKKKAQEHIDHIKLCLHLGPQKRRHREILLPKAIADLTQLIFSHNKNTHLKSVNQ